MVCYHQICATSADTGCGSVWLERRLREAEAAGSNPVTPIYYYNAEEYSERGVYEIIRFNVKWKGNTFI